MLRSQMNRSIHTLSFSIYLRAQLCPNKSSPFMSPFVFLPHTYINTLRAPVSPTLPLPPTLPPHHRQIQQCWGGEVITSQEPISFTLRPQMRRPHHPVFPPPLPSPFPFFSPTPITSGSQANYAAADTSDTAAAAAVAAAARWVTMPSAFQLVLMRGTCVV